MKTILVSLVSLVCAWPYGLMAARHVDGDYIVILNDNNDPARTARTHGVGRKKTWTNAVKGFSTHCTGDQADRMERDPDVAIVELDLPVHALAQTVPTGIRRIGAPSYAQWIASTNAINADIAILDTGVDLTHPDLNVYANVTFIDGTTTGNDDNGHGSHCAGIAAAKNNTIGVVGVAPGARLWAVKVLDSTGSGTLSSIISGVDYVTQHSSEIEVASMSLGGQGQADSLRTAIQSSVAKGVVYVVAAGNSGFEVYGGDDVFGTYDDFFPAAYPEVCTVSALADSDGLPGGLGAATTYGSDDTLATFSNYSKTVVSSNPVYSPGGAIDVAAPGVAIYSTYKSGGYATMSGTSMACPHVSGAVALYIAANGRATTAAGVAAIRQAIINAAEPQTSWGGSPTTPFGANDPLPEGLLRLMNAGSSTNYPALTLTSPIDGLRCTTTNRITFTATALDAHDGNLSSQIWWQSSQPGTGHFYTGSTITGTLVAGTHVISASVTNSGGYVDKKSVTVYVSSATAGYPVVSITSPATGTTQSSPVSFTGTASDSLSDLTSTLTWVSSISGTIGHGGSIIAQLVAGEHTIVAKATNNVGTGSASITITVSGTPPPPAPTNYPPIVTISYPVESETFEEGTGVTVSSSASDYEDGTLTSSIRVNDNINGLLGTGGTILYFPSVGSHTLTASVADSAGSIATATRSFSVYARQTNTPPTIYITAPVNGLTVVSNTAVTLSAIATDTQDGTLVPAWYNSLSGVIGSGASISHTFTTVGTNIITASATDSGGLVAQAKVSVLVTNAVVITNAYPVVTVTAPTNGLTVYTGTVVPYAGTATDAEDGALTVTWVDSIAGNLGTGGSGTYTPAVGTHTLTASATDSQSATGSRSVLVQVNNTNALPTQLTVTVSASPTQVVNKQKVNLTATVTGAGSVVSGATMSFSIRLPSGLVISKTGLTTSTSGTAGFYQQINRSRYGAGIATVTATATKSGYYSGTGTTTFTIR